MARAAPRRPVMALESSARAGAISGSAARTGPVFGTACRRTGSVLGRSGSVFGRSGSVFGRASFAGFSSAVAPFATTADPPGAIASNGSSNSIGPRGSASASATLSGGGIGGSSGGGGGTGSGGGEGGRAALAGGSSISRFRSSKPGRLGAGFAAGGSGSGPAGGGGAAPMASGASPVSSAMPNRSSASSRRAALSSAWSDAAARTLSVEGRMEPVAGRTGPVEGRPPDFPPAPEAGLATVEAPSDERSMVVPDPGDGSADPLPGLRTWNTFLQEVQRTRTPRSVTFSSAMRNFDWQLGHWTTTLAFSLALRRGDKETPSATRCAKRALTHTGACGQMAPYRFASSALSPLRDGGVSKMSEQDQTPVSEVGNGAPETAERKEPKVIKRYTNRTLYDTVES